MGWAKKLPSGMYKAAYRDGEKVLYLPGVYPNKAEAKRQADAKEVAERAKPEPEPERPKTRFADFEPIWQQLRTESEGTKRRKECYWRLHVLPHWRDWNVEDIKRADVQAWVNELSQELTEERDGATVVVRSLAPASVYQCKTMLSSFLEAALAKELVPVNAAKSVKTPPVGPAPDRYLEDAEFDAIQEFQREEQDHLLCDFLRETGMRLGEAYGFHVESYDPVNLTVEVEWNWDGVLGLLKHPKDHERRQIPVSRRFAARLDARIAELTAAGARPPKVGYAKGGRRPQTPLLFTEDGNLPVRDRGFEKRFHRACALARAAGRLVGHVRRHDLRHTFASRLLRRGASLQDVSKLLGHASVKTTERYMHLEKGRWSRVRAIIDPDETAA